MLNNYANNMIKLGESFNSVDKLLNKEDKKVHQYQLLIGYYSTVLKNNYSKKDSNIFDKLCSNYEKKFSRNSNTLSCMK